MRTLARVFALSAFLAMASFSASAQTPTTTPANPPAPTISTAPAMPPEQPAQEIVANPYSLTALWQGGDVIARSTIVILAIMSISTWYVLITKFVEQAFLLRQGREASRKVLECGQHSCRRGQSRPQQRLPRGGRGRA